VRESYEIHVLSNRKYSLNVTVDGAYSYHRPLLFQDLLSHMRTLVKFTHRSSFCISRQPGSLLHFEDELHNLCHIFRKMPFLGAFAKIAKGDYWLHVCPSVHIE